MRYANVSLLDHDHGISPLSLVNDTSGFNIAVNMFDMFGKEAGSWFDMTRADIAAALRAAKFQNAFGLSVNRGY